MLEPTYVTNLASALTFMRELDGANRSEMIDEMIRRAGLDPKGRWPWCACFVAWVGYAVYRKLWPLKRVAGCMSLYADALAKGLIRETPAPGDIFLLWGLGPDGVMRFKHTGFVIGDLGDGWWATVEGNTNEAGHADGIGVFERKRKWGTADRFIRWAGDPEPVVTATTTLAGTPTAPPPFDFWGWLNGKRG